MITGMQRLVAALNGETCDRIPVFCNLLDQGATELGLPLAEYYRNGEYVAEAQLRMRAKYGYDNVWNLFYVGKEAEFFGCQEILFSANGPPNVSDFVIKDPARDIPRLQVPQDLENHPAFAESLKCMKILRAEVGGTYPICVYLSASSILPALLMGMDKWLELVLLGPATLRDELVDKCAAFFRQQLALYRKLGADVIIYSTPFGSTEMFPMHLIEKQILPWMQNDLQDGVAGVVYYCGTSPFNNIINKIIEDFGISCFYISPLADLAESKRIINQRALTCGVINDILLIDWTPAQVRAEVKRIIETGMVGGRFLFGTQVMPYQIPPENIRAMLDAAYEYGRF
jgi:uroporphyrinogen-III decarboxylase